MVSLLVAMRNEESYIEDCIHSILSQNYPSRNLEVIIVDGQSTDNSREIVEKIIVGRDNFSLVHNPKRIQSAAWNRGIDICKGEIISIVSGHTFLAPDYVSKAIETLQGTGADMVGGTVRSISTTKVGEAIALAMSHPFGVGDARFRYTEMEEETDTVFMGFCHRSVYEEIGKYDEELIRNQDDEFSFRLTKSGGRILCDPKIKSHYYSRSTVSSLWKQYYQYGYWKVRVLQKHPRQMRSRQFIPPLFVLSLFTSIIFAIIPILRSLSLVPSLIYFLANLTASAWISYRKGWRYFILLPIVFAILHISYGLGFLVGLVRFINRWGDKEGKVPSREEYNSQL